MLSYGLAETIEFCFRILCAAACGAAIGLERGLRWKEAGIRTHCIISVSAAAYMILSIYAFADYEGHQDLTQIACQIICGISFFGISLTYKTKHSGISGLGTATGIWATAAIGMACGCGMYWLAIFTSLWIVLIQIIFHVSNIDDNVYFTHDLRVELVDSPNGRRVWEKIRKKYEIHILGCAYTKNEDRGTVTVCFKVKMRQPIPIKDALYYIDKYDEIIELST